MANILINGLKAKEGGGRGILSGYLSLLHAAATQDRYFVLTPDRSQYAHLEAAHLTVIDIPRPFKNNVLFPILYFIVFQRLLQRYRIDFIFNFGDIIIPTRVRQVYLFDWAYAVYPESTLWRSMRWKDWLVRKTKVWMIRRYIDRPDTVIAQTRNIKNRLEKLFHLRNVVVIPNAVSFQAPPATDVQQFDLPGDRFKMLVLANYAPHKNFGVLLEVGKIIQARKLPYCIVTTLAEDPGQPGEEFRRAVRERRLEDVIRNLGRITPEQVPLAYAQCDALLSPTLLESYGLTYVEAMHFGRTILTSDFDFAHDVCGEAAFYFDPFRAESVLEAMESAYRQPELRVEKIRHGTCKVQQLLTWPEVFARYQGLLWSAR